VETINNPKCVQIAHKYTAENALQTISTSIISAPVVDISFQN